jgi:hypothetical protein
MSEARWSSIGNHLAFTKQINSNREAVHDGRLDAEDTYLTAIFHQLSRRESPSLHAVTAATNAGNCPAKFKKENHRRRRKNVEATVRTAIE